MCVCGGGGWSFCLAISQGRWKALSFHLRIGCISTMPCGRLFISPNFPTEIFISKKLQAPPLHYSNDGRLNNQVWWCSVGLSREGPWPTQRLFGSPSASLSAFVSPTRLLFHWIMPDSQITCVPIHINQVDCPPFWEVSVRLRSPEA